ncbi:TMEM143 family protein [Baaleninema sp.]|uniref:TMEM143 family protein n=1 Tax=Baaleninema sp. TaxID=3101197 RepID=UPI003CFC3623
MAVYEDREAYIPYRLSDLVELCVSDSSFDESQAEKFREFANLLAAYYHFQFHSYARTILDNYAPFDPDRTTREIQQPTAADLERMEEQVVSSFRNVLERANFMELSRELLEEAFEDRSLIDLKTNVDFEDFDQFLCFYRGDVYQTVQIKKWIFWTREMQLDILERVAVLIKYKGKEYFRRKEIDPDRLEFEPGKTYVYLYKNVPKPDIEFLFPNVKTSMTLKDRLLFIVPAIGAAIPVFIKVLPQLLLVISVVLFLTVGLPDIGLFQADEDDVENLTPVLLAVLSLLVALGGFAFKQYSTYQGKKIKFQKHVTETLFFRNIASNSSVFTMLINAAEEEECKEILLVYYHLLQSPQPLTPSELDDRIEQWMEDKFNTTIDFDINGPLKNLEEIRGGRGNLPLMQYDEKGRCQPLSIKQAKAVIDDIWDNAFQFGEVEI